MLEERVEIVIVEDSQSDIELILRVLKKHNLANRLVMLKDGAEACDYLFAEGQYAGRVGSEAPKVILLDLKLPKVDGLEVLRRLKSDARTKTIPVVVLTASAESRDLEEAYALGANSYVIKPIQFSDFAKVVSDLGLYWMMVNRPPA